MHPTGEGSRKRGRESDQLPFTPIRQTASVESTVEPIVQTASAQLSEWELVQTPSGQSPSPSSLLPWPHFVRLLTVDKPEVRPTAKRFARRLLANLRPYRFRRCRLRNPPFARSRCPGRTTSGC